MRRFLAIVILPALALAAYGAYAVLRPYRGFGEETFVDIRHGAGSLEIASQLRQSGVLQSEWPFLAVRLARPRATLKAGEYRFDAPVSPLDVYRKIARGDVFFYTLTIPEGYNIFEIGDAVARLGVIGRQEFLIEARKGGRIADLAPGAPSLEGFLFPDTYRLTRHTTAEELVGQMLRRFREVYRQLPAPAEPLPAVALASLVEKETAVPAERPLVASVFANRLRAGMPLQCDPTVIYALLLAGRYRGEIYRSDLDFKSPYNTYARPGMPPGPIASPGRSSLQAAFSPAETRYLYFVADNKGGHTFSETVERHAEAVARYRKAAARSNGRPHGSSEEAAARRLASKSSRSSSDARASSRP